MGLRPDSGSWDQPAAKLFRSGNAERLNLTPPEPAWCYYGNTYRFVLVLTVQSRCLEKRSTFLRPAPREGGGLGFGLRCEGQQALGIFKGSPPDVGHRDGP